MGTGLRNLETDEITGRIIGAAIDVHRYLGPGMLERSYELCLETGIRKRDLRVERQVPVPVRYLDVWSWTARSGWTSSSRGRWLWR